MENEIWKDIPGFEGAYQVSNLGRVKSLARLIPNSRKKDSFIKSKERILSLGKNMGGYYHVTLRQNLKPVMFKVHRLVLLTFIGPSTLIVDHLNGIKTDNRLTNLEYVTHRENSTRYHYKNKNNGLPTGVRIHGSKYTAFIVTGRKMNYLGIFNSKEEASNAYANAANDISNLSKYIVKKRQSKYAKGVSKQGNKFYATIRFKGQPVYLGSFDSEELAHTAYVEALNLKKSGRSPKPIFD